MPTPNRREALAAAALAATASRLTAAPARPDAHIKAENDKPGSTDWQLTYVTFDAKAVPAITYRGVLHANQRRGRRADRVLRQHRSRHAVPHRRVSHGLLRRDRRA
jgi:hypothetical protein